MFWLCNATSCFCDRSNSWSFFSTSSAERELPKLIVALLAGTFWEGGVIAIVRRIEVGGRLEEEFLDRDRIIGAKGLPHLAKVANSIHFVKAKGK